MQEREKYVEKANAHLTASHYQLLHFARSTFPVRLQKATFTTTTSRRRPLLSPPVQRVQQLILLEWSETKLSPAQTFSRNTPSGAGDNILNKLHSHSMFMSLY